MSDKVFLDTNVVVYAHDSANPEKQARARELLLSGIASGSTCVSAQVLGELFVVLTRKIASPMSTAEAMSVVRAIGRLEVIEIGRLAVELALHLVARTAMAYWDALIVAAARLGGCSILLSEDLQSGQVFDGVTVRNPFSGAA